MFYFVLILINLFFVLGANAVKDAPEANDAQWGVFQQEARRRPMTLKDAAHYRYNTFRLRGVDIPLPSVRAAEIRFLRPYLEAEDLHALEDVWRDNHPIGSSPRYPAHRPVSESRRLITKAFATMRIAGILAIEGYKPSGDNLVPWRNFVVEKLKEIRDGTIDSTEAKDQHVWKTNQRHAHTYIGLILADIGNHGLHEDGEDQQVLFQEAWNSFDNAGKISQSKRLPLFKAYLMKVKGFTPAGYDEASKEAEVQRLWTLYNTHQHNTHISDARRRSTATDDTALACVAGPGTKRDRHTAAAFLVTQLETAIQASFATLIQDPDDNGSAGAGGFSPRSESDSDNGNNGHDDAPGHLPGDTEARDLSEESDESRREDRHTISSPTPPSRNSERDALFDTPSSSAVFSAHTLHTEGTQKEAPTQQETELTRRMHIPEARIHDPLLRSLQSDDEFSEMTDSLATDFRGGRMDDVVPETPTPPLSMYTAAEGRLSPILKDGVADKSLFMSLEKQRTRTTSRVDSSPVPMPSNEGDFARDMEERSTGASGETQTMDDDVEEAEDANSAQTMDSSEDSEDESESDDGRDQKRSQKAEARAEKIRSEKRASSGSNAQLDRFIEANYQNVESRLRFLRDTEHYTLDQLVVELEKMAGLKFTSVPEGYKRIYKTIAAKGKKPAFSPFVKYLSSHEEDFSKLIPRWIQRAKESNKELTTRDIAEAIASRGKLEGDIQEQQLENVIHFLRRHNIINDSRKQTAADVLHDQDEAVINKIFQDFHAQFLKDLKSVKFLKDLKYGKVLKDFDDGKKPLKTKHFVPLLIETLEQFAGQCSQGTPLKFRSEKVGRHYIENLLRTLELELPGKHTESSMTAFLLDKNNLPHIREVMLEIAPLFEKPSMTYTKASKLFETRLSERTGEDLSFEGNAGAKRMQVYLDQHTEKVNGEYRLKPLPQKTDKRRRIAAHG